jgi:hypothetical protein
VVRVLPFSDREKTTKDTQRAATVMLAMLLAVPLAARAESSAMGLVAGPDPAKWGPVPQSFLNGAMIAVFAGNPCREGPSVVRLKMPANRRFSHIIIRRPKTSLSSRRAATIPRLPR